METLREVQEKAETALLSPFATKSADTQGRKVIEAKCDLRTDFQRDRDRIIHSKAFRRLMHKTQVFISPEGDHYRTRLTHTLEVVQISRTIARALRLNEDLTEAIALGHDLGHTPFGHTGEDALDHILADGFRHNEQSVRVVELLENDCNGINLTREVVDGIYSHRSSCVPKTPEAAVVQLADKIGYINHDIDDAIRAGILKPEELPKDCVQLLGDTSSKRINTLIRSVIQSSADKTQISISAECKEALMQLRSYMFSTVYRSQLQQIERSKIQHMLYEICNHFLHNIDLLPDDYKKLLNNDRPERVVCDYIAGMTDRFAMNLFMKIFVPGSWSV